MPVVQTTVQIPYDMWVESKRKGLKFGEILREALELKLNKKGKMDSKVLRAKAAENQYLVSKSESIQKVNSETAEKKTIVLEDLISYLDLERKGIYSPLLEFLENAIKSPETYMRRDSVFTSLNSLNMDMSNKQLLQMSENISRFCRGMIS